MPLEPGTSLGPYTIEAPLGAGGMGEVYKATDTRLDRTVAIKVLPEHVAADPDLKQRFEREAKTISSLNHPHICTLYDIGSQNGIDFLVMEFIEGDTLAQRLEKGALPLDQALQIAIEIADALDKAHRQGIVHRDLKPGNIMLTKAGAKLLDFGLAKLRKPGTVGADNFSAATTQSEPLTARGTILGTLPYMAPEQLEGKDTDARTDVFAFGAIVYEMVTGRRVFTGDSQASLIGAILKDEPVPVQMLAPTAPRALVRLVDACLAKDPDDRWQAVADLKRQLEWTLEVGSIADATTAVGAKLGRPTTALRGIRAATLFAVVVVTALAFWLGQASSPSTIDRQRLVFDIELLLDARLMTSGGVPPSVAVSPRGDVVVYSARQGGVDRLYLRPLAEPEATPIPGTEGGWAPFYSPDGEWVGFFAAGDLKKVPLSGGPPITVTSVDFLGGAGSWGDGGTILYSRFIAPIMAVSSDGGPSEPATTLDESESRAGHLAPHFLPGGSQFLFADPGSGHIEMQDLTSGVRRPITEGSQPFFTSSGHMVFARGGTVLAATFDPSTLALGTPVPLADGVRRGAYAHFGIAPNGTLVYAVPTSPASGQLVWVARDGEWRSIIEESMLLSHPRVAPDGRRVTFRTDDGVVVYDLERGTGDVVASGARPIWTATAATLPTLRGAYTPSRWRRAVNPSLRSSRSQATALLPLIGLSTAPSSYSVNSVRAIPGTCGP